MDVDHDIMEVETYMSLPTEIAPSEESSMHRLPPDQMKTLTSEMSKTSHNGFWVVRLNTAQQSKSDPGLWMGLCIDVLVKLTAQLDKTDLKGSALTNIPYDHIIWLIEGCNEKELDDMRDGVRKGVIKDDWTKLINHLQLRQISPSTSGQIYQAEETTSQQAKRLDQMFHQAYRGKAAEEFRNGLDVYREIYDSTVHFGRWISVLQSSGTGKSRLVDELGNFVPSLSICLRSDTSPRGGWPPGDQPVVQFFKNSDYQGEELAAAFLGVLMGIVANKLGAQATSNTSQVGAKWNKGFMADWQLNNPTEPAKSSWNECFTEVTTLAFTHLNSGQEAIEVMRLPNPRPTDYSRSVADWHIDLFRYFCLHPYQLLVEVLWKLGQEYFVFAFDECTELGKPVTLLNDWNPQMGMTLIALQRIMKSFDAFSEEDITLWFLLLDTTSSIPDLLLHGPDAPSIRLTEGYIPLPPWPYIGFNQVVPKDHMVHFQIPSDTHHLSHVKVYGCPMWKSLSDTEVLQAAAEKLFFNKSFNPKNVNQVFAAFATRIGLEIGEGEASSRLAIDAVRSHMRILIGVSGRLIITASPSEPMLAIAAASMLNRRDQTYKEALKTLLNELILRGLILDRGLQGELYCRLLLTLARDKTVLPHRGYFVKGRGSNPTIRPAKLSEFFQTLLGRDLGTPEDDIKQTDLCYAFLSKMSRVWINFTHFVQLSECIGEVTPFMLCAAWSAGYAFQCTFHQLVINGFLVAYRGDLDEPFNPDNLFPIPWQSKAKSEAAELALAEQLTAPFIVGENLVRKKPEHVVLLMDLGASSAFGHAKGAHCQLTYGEAKRPAATSKGGKWDGYAREGDKEQEGTHYCLNIHGHSPKQYPVISDLEDQFDQLFQRSLKCSQLEYKRFQEDFLYAIDTLNLRQVNGQ